MSDKSDIYEKKAEDGAPAPSPFDVVPTTDAMRLFATKVETEFRRNQEHRQMTGIDAMLAYAAQSSRMEYDQNQKKVLEDLGLRVENYPPLTRTYVRACNAMLGDIIKQAGDRFIELSPTPVPDLPKNVEDEIVGEISRELEEASAKTGGLSPEQTPLLQQFISQRAAQLYDEISNRKREWAEERCSRMEKMVVDQLHEGKFSEAFHEGLPYLCTYGTFCLVGPVPRVMPVTGCRETQALKGVVRYEQEYRAIPTYMAVNPWDCYPAPNAKDVGDGPLCFVVRYTASTLSQFAEAMSGSEAPDGWIVSTVRSLLDKNPNGGVRLPMGMYDLERRNAEHRGVDAAANECTLEGIWCFMSVRGSELAGFNITKTPGGEEIKKNRYYKTESIVIDGYVVFCRVMDDKMPLPVYKACLYPVPGSWWGDSIAELVRVPQSMQNNALKNLTSNGELAANCIFYAMDANNLISMDGSPVLSLRAGMMFGRKSSMPGLSYGAQGAPIGMIQPKDTTQQQILLLKEAFNLADEYSGIPRYSVGSSSALGSGAGRTASGFAMMTEATCRTVNMCIAWLYRTMIIPCAQNTVTWNLLYSDDISIKGDCSVVPAGPMGKFLREAESQRRQQVMNMVGRHPIYSQAIPLEGHFELLRPELENLGVNPDRIIPSKERMKFEQTLADLMRLLGMQQQMAPQGADVGPTQEQANVARVEGNPQGVAYSQGGVGGDSEPDPGTVAERRNAA